jgi:hypothetical protein
MRKRIEVCLPCCGKKMMIEYIGSDCPFCDKRIHDFAERELLLTRQDHICECKTKRILANSDTED